jgi:predicted restriction endonuclease
MGRKVSLRAELPGAIDDLWCNPAQKVIVVDYKATAKSGEVNINAEWQQAYKRQMEFINGFYGSRILRSQTRATLCIAMGRTRLRSMVESNLQSSSCRTSGMMIGCGITAMLRASHIKPWAKSSNHDRLNPDNGLLLAAHVDALFDFGLISFAENGRVIVSAQMTDDLKQLQLPERLRRKPTNEERPFLAYHRRHGFVA